MLITEKNKDRLALGMIYLICGIELFLWFPNIESIVYLPMILWAFVFAYNGYLHIKMTRPRNCRGLELVVMALVCVLISLGIMKADIKKGFLIVICSAILSIVIILVMRPNRDLKKEKHYKRRHGKLFPEDE